MSKQDNASIMKQVWPILIQHGITVVTANYSGSGDSGSFDSVTFEPEQPEEVKEIKVTVPVAGSYFQDGKWVRSTTMTEMALWEAIQTVADNLVDENHSGWGNDEGAEGNVEFDVPSMEITNNHREYVTSYNDYTHRFDLPLSDLHLMAIQTQENVKVTDQEDDNAPE